MKIKLDENMPATISTRLQALGHDVETVHDEQMVGHPDDEIWRATQKEERFLVTQDLDFSDVRQFAPGTHHGIMVVRLGSPGRVALLDAIVAAFRENDVAQWAGCFVVLTDHKIRVRSPQ